MPSTFFKKGPPGCVALLQHCPTLGSCSCCSIFVLGLFHGEHFPPSKSSGVLLSVSSRVYTLNSQPQRHTCIRSGRTLHLQTPGERHLPNGSQLLGRSVIKANKGAAHGVRCSWFSVLLKMALALRLLIPCWLHQSGSPRRPCFAKSCGAGHDPMDSNSFQLAPPCARNFALNFSCSLVQGQIWWAVQERFLYQWLTSAVRMRI